MPNQIQQKFQSPPNIVHAKYTFTICLNALEMQRRKNQGYMYIQHIFGTGELQFCRYNMHCKVSTIKDMHMKLEFRKVDLLSVK